MVRRTMAVGAALLLVILLGLAIRGCLDARKEEAMKDYVTDVAALVQESDEESRALFDLLSSRGGRDQAVDVQNTLNGFRVQSAQLVDRARATDVPDDLQQAQRFLLETLEFRRDGMAGIADALPTALGDQGRREGTEQVAREMQVFLASDIIYRDRVIPSLRGPLKEEGLLGEVRTPNSQFLPGDDWLDAGTVADRVRGIRTGRPGGAATPGLHGNGLGAVSLGGQTLPPGGSATVRLSQDPELQVQVTNQGESTETDVGVRVTLGRGGDAIELEERLDSIAAGETKPVTLRLTEQPPTGQGVPVQVEIEPVPGEKQTDNNKGSFSAIFTR
jgi:hypothetical protein